MWERARWVMMKNLWEWWSHHHEYWYSLWFIYLYRLSVFPHHRNDARSDRSLEYHRSGIGIGGKSRTSGHDRFFQKTVLRFLIKRYSTEDRVDLRHKGEVIRGWNQFLVVRAGSSIIDHRPEPPGFVFVLLVESRGSCCLTTDKDRVSCVVWVVGSNINNHHHYSQYRIS